jgi:hypothetical protein
MPNADNLPRDYSKYSNLAKKSRRLDVLPLLNKFSFRYRLAESFEGMVAPDVGRTLLGYNVVMKVFLAYTAYEAIVRTARILRLYGVDTHELNSIYDAGLAKRIRNNEKLRNYLTAYQFERGLANKLKLFFNGTTSDIVCVAYAIRNIFAHGDLTASSVGTETIAKRQQFTDLANALLDYCDDTFTKCLEKI